MVCGYLCGRWGAETRNREMVSVVCPENVCGRAHDALCRRAHADLHGIVLCTRMTKCTLHLTERMSLASDNYTSFSLPLSLSLSVSSSWDSTTAKENGKFLLWTFNGSCRMIHVIYFSTILLLFIHTCCSMKMFNEKNQGSGKIFQRIKKLCFLSRSNLDFN